MVLDKTYTFKENTTLIDFIYCEYNIDRFRISDNGYIYGNGKCLDRSIEEIIEANAVYTKTLDDSQCTFFSE